MARRRNSDAQGCGILLGGLLLLGLAILIIKWALITAAILAVPFGAWWIHDQIRQRKAAEAVSGASRRRVELEGRAVVDAAGGCGWCGSRLAHRDRSGTLVRPVDHHRDEIEEALAG